MFVVDVSGHGVAASLLSVSLMHWFDQRFGSAPGNNDTLARESYTPVTVAESLNRDFPMDVNTGQYFTIVYGVLDTSSRTFRYVCAGHPPPVHIPHDGIASATPTSNFPVGITPEPGYDERVIQLDAGDCILLYSDGLTEAKNSDEVEFGIERVLEQVSVKSSAGLDGVVKALLGSVADWAGQRKQIDDVSVLGIEIS
jgi:sigma-B regulation protein RsbU (phosphoserine phosphatase)